MELGAKYIEGASVANPIYTLACQEGVLKCGSQRADPAKGYVCTSDGRAIDRKTGELGFQIFQAIEQEAARLFGQGGGKPERWASLGKFFETKMMEVSDFLKWQNLITAVTFDIHTFMDGDFLFVHRCRHQSGRSRYVFGN